MINHVRVTNVAGSKRVDHCTSGTVYECSEIAGAPQSLQSLTIQYEFIILSCNACLLNKMLSNVKSRITLATIQLFIIDDLITVESGLPPTHLMKRLVKQVNVE
jgi:hypothetical protein